MGHNHKFSLTGEAAEFAGLPRDGIFAETNQNWEGYTATFFGGRNDVSGGVGYPPLVRHTFSTTGGAANRLLSDQNTLNGFSSFTADYWIGGKARIFRPINGVMTLVRTSDVIDAKVGRWSWLKPNADRVVDALTYTHALDTFNRPSVPYWFRVAAVGLDGLAGTFSAPVSFTPANMTGTASGTVNPTKALNKTGEGGALAAPTGVSVTAGAIAREAVISWSAVAGAEGYVVELSYYDPATQIAATHHLDLASDPTPILTNDLVIFDRQHLTLTDSLYCSRIYDANPGGRIKPSILWFTNQGFKRDGNDWSYVAYSGDKPALAFGDHFMRRTANAGLTASLQYYWHSGTDQNNYRVLIPGVTYRLRVVMRASAATTVTFATNSPIVSGTTFSVGTTFAEYTHDMVPASQPTGSAPYDWRLLITAGGTPLSLDVAFLEIEEVGANPNIFASALPPPNSYMRDHSFIKFPPRAFTTKRLAEQKNYSFKTFHDSLVATSTKPWFQLEWHMQKDDALDFVAYLAAPNGAHPMATIRQASGIAQPWTTTFSDMKFEHGNEGWNPQGDFILFPYTTVDSVTAQVYGQGSNAGLIGKMIAGWMQESPYWSILAPKLKLHVGGWSVNNFGEDAYRYFPEAKEVSLAAYNGGWDAGTALVTENGISFSGLLADPIIKQKPTAKTRVSALKNLCTTLGRTYGQDIRYTIYEAGPGYQLNGLNGAAVTAAQAIAQEVVMKSRAAATATVDSMLTYAQQDFLGFNFFLLRPDGDTWSSHAPGFDGGQEFPTNALLRIIHENVAPAKVYGALTATLGIRTVTLQGGGTQDINAIGAYQLRNLANPSKRMIVLVNRNIDVSQLPVSDPLYSATPSGTVAFNITTAWASAASLKVWTAGVGPYRQHNRYPVGQRRVAGGGLAADPLCVTFDYSSQVKSVPANIQNFPINAAVGAAAGGLPAGSCLIMLFEGVTGG